MSLLIFGMSGGALESAPIDTSLSIRERILRNMRVTLESIKATTPESSSSAPGNASGIRHSTGGAYTGTVTRRYKVEVVLAGASGVAQLTVTDVTPEANDDGTPGPAVLWPDGTGRDDGPLATVVTSGVAFVVGSLGATITLTWTGSLVLGNAWYVWAGPYATNVSSVEREDDARDPGEIDIVMRVPGEEPDSGPLSLETNLMVVDLICSVARDALLGQQVSEFLADVKKALRADVTRGGNAVNTTFLGNVGYALSEAKSGGGFDLRVQVLYRHADDNPRALV